MGRYNLPQPAPQPSHDHRGFTDPHIYSSQKLSPNLSADQGRSHRLDVLPGLSQILRSPKHTDGQAPNSQSVSNGPLRPRTSLPSENNSSGTSRTNSTYSRELRPQISRTSPPYQQITNHVSRGEDGRSQITHTSGVRASQQATAQESRATLAQSNSDGNRLPRPSYQEQEIYGERSHTVPSATAPVPSIQQSPPSFEHRGSKAKRNFHNRQRDVISSKPVKLQPRVVGEEFKQGEGQVWVFEDGSTCPKSIDEEPVNPDWGITKAGKPRKRLAVACTTCREKKIKCNPQEPKCVQCEKFGRDCHYATM